MNKSRAAFFLGEFYLTPIISFLFLRQSVFFACIMASRRKIIGKKCVRSKKQAIKFSVGKSVGIIINYSYKFLSALFAFVLLYLKAEPYKSSN